MVMSVKGLVRRIPALFTRTSTVPKRLIAASTVLAAVSCLLISPSTRTKLGGTKPGEAVIFGTVSDRLASSDVATTLYPSFRKPSTKPAPIPPDAPVTIAVFLSDIDTAPNPVRREFGRTFGRTDRRVP